MKVPEIASEFQQDAVLHEFQALREEMMGAINARLWGTLTYVAIAGGIGALFTTSSDPGLLVVLIFSAVPLLWHTASRERARVRIGAYIKEVIEPKTGGSLAWESHLAIWREESAGGKSRSGHVDQWRHILGLTGVYLVVVVYCIVTLVSTGRIAAIVLGSLGACFCFHALLLLKKVYKNSDEYDRIFRRTAAELQRREGKQARKRDPARNPPAGAGG